MPLRIRPGPVFAVELVAGARRWQMFFQRVVLILLLLGTLTMVWATEVPGATVNQLTLKSYAELGQTFADSVFGTQLALILLAAPAATAGAVCLDKARGNLELMLVTDLSSAEIVLGKLSARLIAVLGLIVASLPVLFIGGLMGGVGAEFLLCGFVVLIGAGVLSATLALVFSVWVGKTHEALMLTYFVLLVWLLLYPTMVLITWAPGTTTWAFRINPYALLFAPTQPTWGITLADYGIYLALTFGASALLSAFAMWRLRRVVLRQRKRAKGIRKSRAWAIRARQRLLDRNPLRWYERHRRKPSRAGRIISLLFGTASVAGSIWGLWYVFDGGFIGDQIAFMVALLQVVIGLLLVTIGAATALADERARGNLDILMTTPLSTRYIVYSKWWAAMAAVPRIIVLPLLLVGAECYWHSATGNRRCSPELVVLLVPYLMSAGTFFVCVGLFIATFLRQFGRAVGTAVTIYVAVAVAWPILVSMVADGSDFIWYSILASPPAAVVGSAQIGENDTELNHAIAGMIIWTTLYGFGSLLLYWRTRRVFDRSFGRITKKTSRRKVVTPKKKLRRGLGLEGVEPRGLP